MSGQNLLSDPTLRNANSWTQRVNSGSGASATFDFVQNPMRINIPTNQGGPDITDIGLYQTGFNFNINTWFTMNVTAYCLFGSRDICKLLPFIIYITVLGMSDNSFTVESFLISDTFQVTTTPTTFTIPCTQITSSTVSGFAGVYCGGDSTYVFFIYNFLRKSDLRVADIGLYQCPPSTTGLTTSIPFTTGSTTSVPFTTGSTTSSTSSTTAPASSTTSSGTSSTTSGTASGKIGENF